MSSKKVTITLIVEAKKLYNLTNPEVGDINARCRLKDNKGESHPDSPLNGFVTDVYVGKEVIWEGKPNDAKGEDKGYSVEIDNIVYEPTGKNKNFFNRKIVCGKSGVVSVDVKDDTHLETQKDNYLINFSIVYPEGSNGIAHYFYIDPQLKGNP